VGVSVGGEPVGIEDGNLDGILVGKSLGSEVGVLGVLLSDGDLCRTGLALGLADGRSDGDAVGRSNGIHLARSMTSCLLQPVSSMMKSTQRMYSSSLDHDTLGAGPSQLHAFATCCSLDGGHVMGSTGAYESNQSMSEYTLSRTSKSNLLGPMLVDASE